MDALTHPGWNLRARADSYADDARKFRDCIRIGKPMLSAAEDTRWAEIYTIVASELRKIAGAGDPVKAPPLEPLGSMDLEVIRDYLRQSAEYAITDAGNNPEAWRHMTPNVLASHISVMATAALRPYIDRQVTEIFAALESQGLIETSETASEMTRRLDDWMHGDQDTPPQWATEPV
jgi:hypothetical protein